MKIHSKQLLTKSPDFIAKYTASTEQKEGHLRILIPDDKGESDVLEGVPGRTISIKRLLGQGTFKNVFEGIDNTSYINKIRQAIPTLSSSRNKFLQGVTSLFIQSFLGGFKGVTDAAFIKKYAISIATTEENSPENIDLINTNINKLRQIFSSSPSINLLFPELIEEAYLLWHSKSYWMGKPVDTRSTLPVYCQVSPKFDTSLAGLNSEVKILNLTKPELAQIAIDNIDFVARVILGKDGIAHELLKYKIAHNDMHFGNYLVHHDENLRIRHMVLIDWDRASHFKPPHPSSIHRDLLMTSLCLRAMPSHITYTQVTNDSQPIDKTDLIMYMLWQKNPSLKSMKHPDPEHLYPFTSPHREELQLLHKKCTSNIAIDITYELQQLFIATVRSDLDPHSNRIVSPVFKLLKPDRKLCDQFEDKLQRELSGSIKHLARM